VAPINIVEATGFVFSEQVCLTHKNKADSGWNGGNHVSCKICDKQPEEKYITYSLPFGT